jgi:glycosyltransferase involved in cell wall biosynthesis
MSRIAIVDLLFNWPPDGGARTDVKEIASRLSKEHEVCIFVPGFTKGFPRGQVRSSLSLDIKRIKFNTFGFNFVNLPLKFRKEIDKFKPDHVFIADAWYLKPHLVNALLDYKPYLRFYAYETICLRGHGVFYKNEEICSKNYLVSSLKDIFGCLRCSLGWLKFIRDKKFIHEFAMAGAFMPFYRDLVVKAIKNSKGIIVYNQFIKDKICSLNNNIFIVPSGVDKKLFQPNGHIQIKPYPKKKTKILMAGRVEDRLKGVIFLLKACNILRNKGYDLEVLLTSDNIKIKENYITYLGWLSQEKLAKVYNEVDICVVPSLWPEPFGIVALEAMSSAKPVIVTDVGGLKSIVSDGIDGFVVETNNIDMLADRLAKLINDADLRKEMGLLGRKKVEENFDWDIVYDKYYRSLFK